MLMNGCNVVQLYSRQQSNSWGVYSNAYRVLGAWEVHVRLHGEGRWSQLACCVTPMQHQAALQLVKLRMSIVNRTWACGGVYEVPAVVALQFESLGECSMVWRCVPM